MINIDKLNKIKFEAQNRLALRMQKQGNLNDYKNTEILICGSKGCEACGSEQLAKNLKKEIKSSGLSINVDIVGCFGLCAEGPIVFFVPQNIFYCKVQPADAKEIVESHILKNELIERLLHTNQNGKKAVYINNVDFYDKQKFIALQNITKINASKIEDYIAFGGYFSLHKAITSMTPEQIVQEVKISGLRGRGGAGFSTGTKWGFAQKEIAKQKYVVCNGDEGDPGAFMDRTILECNPHTVLEAMAICGKAIGADKGIIYVRAEYGFAVLKLKKALSDATKLGLLGQNILNTGFNFDISISLGAGAFVCGEETALLTSIEGNRGEPKTRPPYPTTAGLWGCPTVINNVETWANITQIIEFGGSEFAKTGSKDSKGTKVFALSGKIKNTGLIELPIGTPLKEIIYNIGGGIPNSKKFKAVQIGGPSGGCIPESLLDTPVDYSTLNAVGSMMGSGGMIVVDEDTCMVDFAKFFLQFTCDESCGKCTPCRIGNKRLLEILTKITDGNGTMQDLEDLETLSNHIKQTSLCGLGQSSPNPILSTLKYFKNEYIAHIKDKKCPAGVCKKLISYHISEKCIGCGICKNNCPAKCISGEPRSKHYINEKNCIKCGLCKEKCPVGAIEKIK